jgi:hypothetical protein
MTVTREVQDMWDKRNGLLCIFPLQGGQGGLLLRSSLPNFRYSLLRGSLVDPRLRASNESSFRSIF